MIESRNKEVLSINVSERLNLENEQKKSVSSEHNEEKKENKEPERKTLEEIEVKEAKDYDSEVETLSKQKREITK